MVFDEFLKAKNESLGPLWRKPAAWRAFRDVVSTGLVQFASARWGRGRAAQQRGARPRGRSQRVRGGRRAEAGPMGRGRRAPTRAPPSRRPSRPHPFPRAESKGIMQQHCAAQLLLTRAELEAGLQQHPACPDHLKRFARGDALVVTTHMAVV
jgi:hypothetical protein